MSNVLIDQSAMQDFMKDDPELLADLSVIFVRHLPRSLTNLEMAIEQRDASLLGETAHQLKGQLSYFFCETLVECAWKLEELAQKNQVKQATSTLKTLTDGIEELIVELNQLTELNLQVDRD